ncbi:helix-turn-helix domain-containing protein, partial [uncultured Desulfovibrio sp.]
MSCIGDVLKLYRTRFHLSQGDLAKLLDISVNFLSQVENGKKKISFTKLGD